MPLKRYKRWKKKHTGGDTLSYTFSNIPFPETLDNEEYFDYFIENEREIISKLTDTNRVVEHISSVSVLYEDMDDHDTNIFMGMIDNRPYYVCYVTDGNTIEMLVFHPISLHTPSSVMSSRILYLDLLRKYRQINGIDALKYLKGLVRDPAFAVPIGIYLLAQGARRVRHETIEEEFNKPTYHRKKISYDAYEILPNDTNYLFEDPMPNSSFWDQGFKIDADDIFALCKREIDFSYLSKSLTSVKKDARVVVVFGHDEKGNMKGIRVMIITGDKGSKDINYWGKFACADGLGAIIQKKSIEILRMELAYLATVLQDERRGDNLGPVLRSWTNPNYIKSRDYRNMRFRAIKSAVSFWQYMGYSIYKLAPKGDAFFEAKALPSDSGSRTRAITKRRKESKTNSSLSRNKKKRDTIFG